MILKNKLFERSVEGIIFDVDGVILDSMPSWQHCGRDYLRSINKDADDELGKRLFHLTIKEGAHYIKEHFHIDREIEDIVDGMMSMVKDYYFQRPAMKTGVGEFLERMYRKSIPMTIVTSTGGAYIEAAFGKLGISRFFGEIYSAQDLGMSKSEPYIFRKAMEQMGSSPEDTWVFEDGLYAIRTAKKEGLNVVGVYDSVSEDSQEEIKKIADVYIESFNELYL